MSIESMMPSNKLRTLSCSMWGLVSWPGMEPGLPAMGVRILSHWTIREVPQGFFFILGHDVKELQFHSPEWGSTLRTQCFPSAFGPRAEFISACSLGNLYPSCPHRGRAGVLGLISAHLIRLSLMLVQNQRGRKPAPNSLHHVLPEAGFKPSDSRCEPSSGLPGILAMVAASWRVTMMLLGAGGLGLSGGALVGRVDTDLSPLLQFSVSYSKWSICSANYLVLFISSPQSWVSCLLGAKLCCSAWHFVIMVLLKSHNEPLRRWLSLTTKIHRILSDHLRWCSLWAVETLRLPPGYLKVLCSFFPSIP